MARATLSDRVVISGYDLWGFRKAQALLEPAGRGTGITFMMDQHTVPYDIRHVYGVRGTGGARFVVASECADPSLNGAIGGGYQMKVVEHLMAAVHLAGITDIRVLLKGGAQSASVPQEGPGIKPHYERLMAHRHDVGVPVCEVRARAISQYSFYNEKIGRATSVIMEPAETLEIKVLASRQPDLVDLEEQPFHLEDVYAQKDNHLEARPLARIAQWPVFGVWGLARLAGYQGITNENYVLCKPWETRDDIVAKMHPQYRAGANEFLAHAVLDFVGELAALGATIKASFTLQNSNHLTRIAAIKQFVREGLLR